MAYVPDIRVTLAYSLVAESNYRIDPAHKFGALNARSEFVDCFYDNILVHRETVVRVARQRCVLPEPADWTENPIKVPRRKARFAKLIHVLAGFVDAAAPELGHHHAGPLRDGLKTLQLAFREYSDIPDAPGAGPGERWTGPVFS